MSLPSPIILLGLMAAALGCAALYLASANQRWRAHPLPTRPACGAGVALLAAGGVALGHAMQWLPALFTLVTWAMLLLALFPYLGALLTLRRPK